MNDARVGQYLEPVCKNIHWRQNPYGIIFDDKSKFDIQNPIIGSLLGEIDSGKLTGESVKFPNSVPSVKDIEINKRIESFKNSNHLMLMFICNLAMILMTTAMVDYNPHYNYLHYHHTLEVTK